MRHLFVLATALAASTVSAHEFSAGTLLIDHPAVRATPGPVTTGAGYLTIRNSGTQPDRLIAIESPASARVEVHRSTNEGGIARMRPVTDGLEIAPGAEIVFAPASLHLMFVDLVEPFRVGETVPATLVFERAGRVEVVFNVEPIGGAPAEASHAGH